jgi:hypothetical protein
MTGMQHEAPSLSNDDMLRIATELESENPLWLVVFGIYTRQFVAFPRFRAPRGSTMAVATHAGALTVRMREIERQTQGYPAERIPVGHE